MNVRSQDWTPFLCAVLLLPACSGPPRDAPAPLATPAPLAAPDDDGPVAIARTGNGGAGEPRGGGKHALPMGSDNQVSYLGGKVLSDVVIVAVYWGNGLDATVAATMPDFYTAVVDNPYLDWLSEYDTPKQGICRGSFDGAYVITPANKHAHLFDSEIKTELAQQIDAGNLDSDGDPYNPNKLYMIHFPPGISITTSAGESSCASGGFCAYHTGFWHNGKALHYAVLPDMSDGSPCDGICGGGSPIQNQTSAASHELMEAITDPEPFSGWSTGVAGRVEIGDSCNQQQATLPGTSFVVQKTWSNAQQDCVVTRPVPVSPPRIDRISPASAAYNTATWVYVSGSCFNAPSVTVSKNGLSALAGIASWEHTRTLVEVELPAAPDGTAGTGQITVANSGATATAGSAFDYFYVGPNNVSISPANGGMQGGTAVTISGEGFAVWPDVTTVTFGGVPATSVSCSSSTSCVAWSPPHDPGIVPVVVTASGSSQPSANGFTYVGPQITSVTPDHGPITGGTRVTVYGVNMVDTSQTTFYAAATFGGVALGSVLCLREGSTDGSCWLTSPAASLPAGPVDIQLTVEHTTGTLVTTAIAPADRFTYTELPAPSELLFSGGAVGGATVTGTVTLDGYAPAGGAVVSLALAPGAPADVVSLPGTMTVDGGQPSGSFPVTIIAQSYTGSVPVVASYGGVPVTGILNVLPTPAPVLAPIAQLCSGQTFLETITLAEPAPPGGGVVNLSSGSALAAVPPTVTVPAGATTATFPVTTASPASAQTATVSASYYGVAASPISFPVLPSAAIALSLPTGVDGGGSATGTVTLCLPAPAGSSVTLASNSAYASVPASLPISGTSASFTVTTTQPFNSVNATISATYAGMTASQSLAIAAPPRCPAGKRLCTCGDGSYACLSTAQQCFSFCAG